MSEERIARERVPKCGCSDAALRLVSRGLGVAVETFDKRSEGSESEGRMQVERDEAGKVGSAGTVRDGMVWSGQVLCLLRVPSKKLSVVLVSGGSGEDGRGLFRECQSAERRERVGKDMQLRSGGSS